MLNNEKRKKERDEERKKWTSRKVQLVIKTNARYFFEPYKKASCHDFEIVLCMGSHFVSAVTLHT